ncbi:MAG: glycosyltransferase [Coriobacteriia bacterium]|nr:glycosyltransferase [Coriobacteriia bacterium]
MPSALFVTTVDITLEAFLLPFAAHLREAGWRVDALARGAETNDRIASAFDARFDAGWTRSPFSPASIGAIRRVRQVVSEGSYDLVWVHTPVAAMITRFALRKRAGRPVVIYTAHGFHFYEGGRSFVNAVYRTVERAAAAWTDYLVTINAEDYSAARGFRTIPPERVLRFPGIGVDPTGYAPSSTAERARMRTDLGVPPDSILVTMIAEFTPNKRHALALAALAEVETPNVYVAFAGNGPLLDEVRRDAARRGLEDRVRLCGYRRDVPALLGASDAVMLVSAREGLSRSLLESMASGVPLIGTPTRGIADLIGRDETGWVAKSHSREDLSAAIDAAAADPDERIRRGRVGLERARADYSIAKVLDAYDDLFAQALEAQT